MSSLSTSLYGASTNKGVGGLLSGLDTDDLVKQMTAATRNKINRQYQAKQKLIYRQEAYREISKKLLTFSDKYFSYSSGSKTNILSSKFFESNTFKSPSNYINVTGNAENIKNFSIDNISSVASAATLISNKNVSNRIISSDVTQEYISPLAGETFSIKYNDITYNLSIDKDFKGQSFDEVKTQLNKQLLTIKDSEGNPLGLEYSYTLNTENNNQALFSLTDGAYLSAASSDFLSVLNMTTGEASGGSSTEFVSQTELFKTDIQILSNTNEYITFDYNGVKKQINLKDSTDANSLAIYLQEKFDLAYGKNADDTSKVTISESGGVLSFEAAGSTNVFGISSISSDLSQLTGLAAGEYNRINQSVEIGKSGIKDLTIPADNGEYSITINNKTLTFAQNTSISEIIKTINNDTDMKVKVNYSSTTDAYSIVSDETGSHTNINIQNNSVGSLSYALFGDVSNWTKTNGKDTEMSYTLNGTSVNVTRSTANFTIDEINIELNEKASTIDFTNSVSFDVTNNADEVVERVKQFINDYNEIINLIGSKTSEKPKKNYLPLTPEQQDEMEEKEIENWTTEAKKGVLFGDSKMNNVLRDMRGAMLGLTDVSSITLSSIGISSARMDTSGKLTFDEAKFKEKLLENPDEIANLFTLESTAGSDSKSGISIQLQEILKENIGNYGTTGLLVEEAGLAGNLTADKNYISEKIEDYDDKMAELKKDLEAERKRYWNKFSALESSLNRLNAQSSWLTDSMGQ